MKDLKKWPLFVYEMANNHMGDVEHGIRIDSGSSGRRRRFFRSASASSCSIAISTVVFIRTTRAIRPEVCEALLRNPSELGPVQADQGRDRRSWFPLDVHPVG